MDAMNSPQRSWFTLLPALLGGAGTGLGLAVGWHWGVILITLNAGTVLPGHLYRSGQPSPEDLTWLVRKHGIRTVINLRGDGSQFDWYRNEAITAANLGLSQEDILLSASRLPSPQAIRQLIDALDRSPRPILVHCQQGVDRTGVAVVVALLLYTDMPLEEARREMSLGTGHIPMFRTRFIGRFFLQYRDWLAELGLEHTPIQFRVWATRYYAPAGAEARWLSPDGPVHVKTGERTLLMARVRNLSSQTWKFRADPGVGVSARWYLLKEDGSSVSAGMTGFRDAEVAPGETFDVPIVLPYFPPKGRYRLKAELITPDHTTFTQLGSPPLDVEVMVP